MAPPPLCVCLCLRGRLGNDVRDESVMDNSLLQLSSAVRAATRCTTQWFCESLEALRDHISVVGRHSKSYKNVIVLYSGPGKVSHTPTYTGQTSNTVSMVLDHDGRPEEMTFPALHQLLNTAPQLRQSSITVIADFSPSLIGRGCVDSEALYPKSCLANTMQMQCSLSVLASAFSEAISSDGPTAFSDAVVDALQQMSDGRSSGSASQLIQKVNSALNAKCVEIAVGTATECVTASTTDYGMMFPFSSKPIRKADRLPSRVAEMLEELGGYGGGYGGGGGRGGGGGNGGGNGGGHSGGGGGGNRNVSEPDVKGYAGTRGDPFSARSDGSVKTWPQMQFQAMNVGVAPVHQMQMPSMPKVANTMQVPPEGIRIPGNVMPPTVSVRVEAVPASAPSASATPQSSPTPSIQSSVPTTLPASVLKSLANTTLRHCVVCDTTINGDANWMQHIAGDKHAKKSKRAGVDPATVMPQAPPPPPPKGAPAGPKPPAIVVRRCEVCNVSVNGEHNWQLHQLGAAHIRNLNISQFLCKPCGKQFPNSAEYEQHELTEEHVMQAKGPSGGGREVQAAIGPPT